MNKQTAIALLAAASFGLGLGAGLWIGFGRVPATPPPAWLLSEFKSTTKPGSSLQNVVQSRPDLWREINAELQTLRPQIEDYKERLKEIDDDFRRDFEAVLTPAQRNKLAELQLRKELPKIHVDFAPKKPQASTPPPAPAPTQTPAQAPAPKPERLPRMPQESADGLVAAMILVPYTQERFTQALGLDNDQQTRLHELLLVRRDRFIKLSDDSPPPSMQLNRIADIVRRAEAEEAHAEKQAK